MTAARFALGLLVTTLAVVTLTEGLRGSVPKNCCLRFQERPVNKDRVVSYFRTSQRCLRPAIRLTMKKMATGRTVCVRPSDTWVESLTRYLDAKSFPGKRSSL